MSIKPEEAKRLISAFSGTAKPSVYELGLFRGHVVHDAAGGRTIDLQLTAGICAVKTAQCVLLGFYNSPSGPASAPPRWSASGTISSRTGTDARGASAFALKCMVHVRATVSLVFIHINFILSNHLSQSPRCLLRLLAAGTRRGIVSIASAPHRCSRSRIPLDRLYRPQRIVHCPSISRCRGK